MQQKFGWAAETPELLFATLEPLGAGLRHHLVVEALPQGGWDWLAWANDGARNCLQGTCSSRICAMRAAEDAAEWLATSPTPWTLSAHGAADGLELTGLRPIC